jgi:molybdopterin converting factor subunit 1
MSEGAANTVNVLFFAAARDAARASEWRATVSDTETVASLRAKVLEAFPALKSWARALRFAVDGEYARDDDRVLAGCEVAVIPPVAGG